MSVRTKVLGLVDVIMRVPPLLVIDEILKISMGLPGNSDADNNNNNFLQSATSTSESKYFNSDSMIDSLKYSNNNNYGDRNVSTMILQTLLVHKLEFYHMLSITTIKFIACLLGCLFSAFIFMLWTRHLVIVYMFAISVGSIFLSYWSNITALELMENSSSLLEDVLSLNMNRLLDPGGIAFAVLPHLLAQWIIGMSFCYIHLGPRLPFVQKILPFCFLMPILIGMLPLPNSLLKHTPVFASIIPLILTKISLWNSSRDISKTITNGYLYAKNFATNFGLSALVENEWQRLNVPCVLRAFWIIRLLEQLLTIILTSSSEMPLNFFTTVQNLLVSGCETLTALLGMTSIISIICHYIGKLFKYFLHAENYDEDRSIGTVSAILFYILALQTGLTSLSPDKRFIRLCRNFCLLLTALLHFLHNIVSPILMSLSAARNPSRERHAKALIVCLFLLAAPISLLTILWSGHSPSTWLLAVTAFSVEVIVKVLVSLATYTLFLLDARRQTFWEKLDDYVYYIRAFGNSVEFCFGIFLFFNGAWILIFEAGGAIRALMMCIHAYFNIWCEAKAGWTVFMKRRTAVHKISSLPEATTEQIMSFDDVCAICYQEMATAKVTRCKHFFHGVCLRKWLYVQDRCPLCHEIMMYQEPRKTNSETQTDVTEIDNNVNNDGETNENEAMQPNPSASISASASSSSNSGNMHDFRIASTSQVLTAQNDFFGNEVDVN